jgi:hypothetical protein
MDVVEPNAGGGKSAIGAGDDVLSADDPGVAHDPLGNQFRVLHQIRGVADDSGNEDRAGGRADLLEDVVRVLVPRIGRLEGVRAGVDLEDDVPSGVAFLARGRRFARETVTTM